MALSHAAGATPGVRLSRARRSPPTAVHAAKDFGLIYAVCYCTIFALALTATLFGLPWRRWFPGAEVGGSLTGDVSSAVYTLMSHLQ
ncbi:MAG: hypothetical protein AB7P21_10065 [Lautropia sp.]